MIAAAADTWVGLGIAGLLLVYLVLVLVFPAERSPAGTVHAEP